MNPLDYWYSSNGEIRTFFDDYLHTNLERLGDYPELQKDCGSLYETGSATEKIQALTLLSAVKLYDLV